MGEMRPQDRKNSTSQHIVSGQKVLKEQHSTLHRNPYLCGLSVHSLDTYYSTTVAL